MHPAFHTLNLAAVLVLAALSTSASAQNAVVLKSTCQDVGQTPREALGDREGHGISVGQYSCRNEGGATDGAVMTGMVIWEWDKGAAVMVSGNGVNRKPGGIAVYQNSAGTLSPTMSDGKMTGVTGTAKGVYKTASGSMASLAGKSFTSTFHSIGSGQFVIETTVE